jgi:hypothetical protein
MLYVVIGTSAGKPREEIMAVYPRHKAFLDAFVARGEVVGVGPFVDGGGGNMAIFGPARRPMRSRRRPVRARGPGPGVPGQGVGRPDAVVTGVTPAA